MSGRNDRSSDAITDENAEIMKCVLMRDRQVFLNLIRTTETRQILTYEQSRKERVPAPKRLFSGIQTSSSKN